MRKKQSKKKYVRTIKKLRLGGKTKTQGRKIETEIKRGQIQRRRTAERNNIFF